MATAEPEDDWGENLQEQIDELNVAVQVPDGGVTVNTWVPYGYDIQTCENMVSTIPSRSRPNFERTTSGRHWQSSFKLSYLTPVHLNVSLPRSYPSTAPPAFSTECVWLDKQQLSALCAQLDALWVDCQNTAVLFTWIDWLQSNALSHLGIESAVVLTRPLNDEERNDCDPRAADRLTDLHDDLVNLLRHDVECENQEFAQQSHMCAICFDDKPGTEFVRIEPCGHFFCRDCLQSHCQIHTKEGSVNSLTCADNDCDEQIPQYVLKALLGNEEYERYERLHLQKTLETMGDVEYCPRCQFVVLVERRSEENFGHCLQCTFTFCTMCRDSWHAGEVCVDIATKLAMLKEGRSKKEMGAKDRARIERNLKMEYLNIVEVKKLSRPCPHCRMDIHKYDGCNKVTCSACHRSMCWVCGDAINGYDHFTGGKCILFTVPGGVQMLARPVRREAPRAHRRVQEALAADRGAAARRLLKCPRCAVQNLKQTTNNHVRCWNCRSNVCYQCKELISGNIVTHFNAAMPCDQHSAEEEQA